MIWTSAASFVVNTLLLKGSLVLALGGALIVIFRRASASHRHWIGCLTFTGLFLLAALSSFSPRLELGVLPAATPTALESSVPLTPRSSIPNAFPKAGVSNPPPAPSGTLNWMGTLWFLGFLVLLGRVLFDLGMLYWVSSRSRAVLERQRMVVSECLSRLHWNHPVQCLIAPHVTVPMVWGHRHPALLLPESATAWSEDKLRIVLLHELGHLKRGDPLTTLLAQFVCALYWVNPLIWPAIRRLNSEREQACDELVLRTGTDRIGYANQLVDFARTLPPAGTSAGVAMAHQAGLKGRIQTILDSRSSARTPNRKSLALSGVLSLAFVVPVSLGELTERRPPHPSASFETLVTDVERGSAAARKRAVWTLGEREDSRAVSALLAALTSADAETRGLAAWALGEIKDRRAVTPLAEAVDDEDVYAREMIMRALGEIEDPRAVAVLLRALGDEDAPIRAAAVWSLGEIGTEQAMSAVARAMSDQEPLVRTAAMRVLAESAASTVFLPMMEALSDPEPAVRLEAARALGRIGDPRAVDPLIEALRDDDPGVRAWVLWALDEIAVNP